jgi:asparagine synthase (glutamine-hydrolysing)
MCGICGVIGAPPDDIEPAVRRMMDSMTHRGPDDEGFEILPLFELDQGRAAAFGFRRLAIIDLTPAGHQPMFDPETGDCLVFNGEIYNFRALRIQLQLEGRRFRGHSDSEVLLKALSTWGIDALQRIEGMFAFAWYEARYRRITLARDRVGIKPLYWTTHHNTLAFASEIKALHTLPWLDRTIDVRAAVSHISNLCALNDRTMFAAVRRLQPGHLLTWDAANGVSLRRYSDPPYTRPPTILDRSEATRLCRETLQTSVDRQCIADVTVGGFLSGGVDSSIIATLASQSVPVERGYPAFTIALANQLNQQSDGFAEDLPFAELMAKHLGLPLTGVMIDTDSLLRIDQMVWQLDEPIGDPAAVNVSAICAAARAQGVKVLLSGAGADDVFSGYRRHQALMYQGTWTWLPGLARRAITAATSRLRQSHPTVRRLSRVLRDSRLSENERIIGAFLWLAGEQSAGLLSEEATKSLVDWTPEQEFLATLESLPSGTHRLNRMLALEQRHFLADHNLIYTDKMSMAHGVEVRVPFLDDAVVRLAGEIAPQLNHRTWGGKSVLRDAAKELLPPAILNRSKTGFGSNLRQIMSGELMQRILDLAHGSSPVCGGLFSPHTLRKLAASHTHGEIDASYPLYTVLCIESWVRQFGARL